MTQRNYRRFARIVAIALLSLFALAAPAFAEDVPAGAKPAATKDEGWQPVEAGSHVAQPGESIPASGLVAAAYGLIWVMVAGFVLSVWVRQQRLEREQADLRARIADAERRTSRS